jgi:hypothetical protein
MSKIAILKDTFSNFDGEMYIVDLYREFGGYKAGDLICGIQPFGLKLPLSLEIAIRVDGSLIFRAWKFSGRWNNYLHTHEIAEPDSEKPFTVPFVPTEQQIDTVNGLFSGRIKFEGLKLAVGVTVQNICPIDVKREEELIGKKIFLA